LALTSQEKTEVSVLCVLPINKNYQLKSIKKTCHIWQVFLILKKMQCNRHTKVCGKIDSVKNPLAGKITADSIGQIIMEEEICDKSKTQIICKE
jgi:hypothetical protein